MIYSIAAVAVLFFILFKISVSSNKKKGGSFSGDLADAQLQKIRAADFTKSNVMNVSEGKVYDAVTALVARYGFPVRIFPQVSLGEILKSKDRGAFFSVNSKRVDFVIADMKNAPFAVLEFQGAGHYQNHAEKRDLIKKTACEKAGITYWEIKGQYSEEAISPLMEYLMSLYGQPSSSH